MAYALLYEQTLARWAAHAAPDADGSMPDPIELLNEVVG